MNEPIESETRCDVVIYEVSTGVVTGIGAHNLKLLTEDVEGCAVVESQRINARLRASHGAEIVPTGAFPKGSTLPMSETRRLRAEQAPPAPKRARRTTDATKAADAARKAILRRERLADVACTACGSPNLDDGALCGPCRAKDIERKREFRIARHAEE